MRNDRLRINSVEICAVAHFKTCRLSTFHWIFKTEFRVQDEKVQKSSDGVKKKVRGDENISFENQSHDLCLKIKL